MLCHQSCREPQHLYFKLLTRHITPREMFRGVLGFGPTLMQGYHATKKCITQTMECTSVSQSCPMVVIRTYR